MSVPGTAPGRQPVIAGLGMTDMSKRVYGKTAGQFACDAIRTAAADAGVRVSDIGGLLTNAGIGRDIGMSLAADLQMRNLRMQSEIQSYGASAGAMVQYASMAVASGMVDMVVCVFADAPLRPSGGSAGGAYGGGGRSASGYAGVQLASGIKSATSGYALAASRHMARFGTTTEQLAAVAVSTRGWAMKNPLAQMRTPLTVEDHQASRMITEPFHLFDCCLVSNGAIAVIVTTADRAQSLRQPPVHVLGWAQTHPGYPLEKGSEFGIVSGAAISGPEAMKMAGISLSDVDVAEIYDCYTFTTLISLEDYGFCEKGEGGAFVESGAIGPDGDCPVNTGGGQLSSYYMWGMTPLSEAIIQARGQGGERQVAKHDVVLVSGNGGILQHHSTLILSPHAHT